MRRTLCGGVRAAEVFCSRCEVKKQSMPPKRPTLTLPGAPAPAAAAAVHQPQHAHAPPNGGPPTRLGGGSGGGDDKLMGLTDSLTLVVVQPTDGSKVRVTREGVEHHPGEGVGERHSSLVAGSSSYGTMGSSPLADGLHSEGSGSAPGSALAPPGVSPAGSGILATGAAAEPSLDGSGMLLAPKRSVSGKIMFDDLEIGPKVGAGSQGSVRQVRHRPTGVIYALKSIGFAEDRETTLRTLRSELKRTAELQHPNVVTSLDAYFRESKVYILMEFMDAGTCRDVNKARQSAGLVGWPEPYVAYMARNLFLGLAHLHEANVIHRDIKPSNLLLGARGAVKIADFGVASADNNKVHMTGVGSMPYMSPERIKSQPYSASCDVWSAGLTVAEMAIGEYPFGPAAKSNPFALGEIITATDRPVVVAWELGRGKTFSPELISFVNDCILPIESRPSAPAMLLHPFLAAAADVDPAVIGQWFRNPHRGDQ